MKKIYEMRDKTQNIHSCIARYVELFKCGLITFEDVIKEENQKYSDVFNMSPTQLGKYSEQLISNHNSGVCKSHNNSYDLLIHEKKIEVKSSRFVFGNESLLDLSSRAMNKNDVGDFLMNFQQIKPKMFDCIVLVAFYLDDVFCWVLTNLEIVKISLYCSKQHRGNEGEGQLQITNKNIHLLDDYKINLENLDNIIKGKS